MLNKLNSSNPRACSPSSPRTASTSGSTATSTGAPTPGTEDRAPFPTQLRLDVSPGRLCRFAIDRHLAIVSESYYESNYQIRLKEKYVLFRIGAGLVQGLVKMFSLGRLDARRTEYLLVLRKGDTDSR